MRRERGEGETNRERGSKGGRERQEEVGERVMCTINTHMYADIQLN